jgi:TetR/AcrR family transcriptional regulator, transcriptional repressor of aconitase
VPKVAESYLESRRREIIDASMTCFARQGFHRTTIQDIVQETGLSAGAIYRYFPSKEDIVAAIADERRNPDAAILSRAAKATDLTAALRDLVHGSLGRLADPAEQRWRRVTIQVWAEALRDERVMAVVRRGLDPPIEVLSALIERGRADGTFSEEIDPKAAARVCASMFYGLVLQQAWDPKLDVDAYSDVVLALLDALTGRVRKRAVAARTKRKARRKR